MVVVVVVGRGFGVLVVRCTRGTLLWETQTLGGLLQVYSIGLSPADIEAGNANGVRTLAVATGSHPAEYLAAFNPSYALPDLFDTEAVRALLLGR